MGDMERDVPGDDEVTNQLDRMLASPHFSSSGTQAKLLRYVVEMALAKQTITQGDILVELYGVNVDPFSTKAKANANLVREKVEEYFSSDGKDDLVRIRFPPGPGYKPVFSYHERAEGWRAYSRAIEYKKQATLNSLGDADNCFLEATRLMPDYAPAYAEWSEASSLQFVLNSIFFIKFKTRGASDANDSEWTAKTALTLDPNNWQAHIALGAGKLLSYEWREAQRLFDKALELDRERTESNLWYAAYLMTITRWDEALEIVELRIAECPHDVGTRLAQILFLYATRDYQRAYEQLSASEFRGEHADVFWLLEGFVHLATGNNKNALKVLGYTSEIDNKLWGIYRRIFKYRGGKPERFQGMKILATVGIEGNKSAQRMMDKLRFAYPAGPLQLALGYMALGKQARAMAALRRAILDHDIFMNWLHFLPIFDPLRSHPRFQQMVREFVGKQGFGLR